MKFCPTTSQILHFRGSPLTFCPKFLPHETKAFQFSGGPSTFCPKFLPHETKAFQFSLGPSTSYPKIRPNEIKVFYLSFNSVGDCLPPPSKVCYNSPPAEAGDFPAELNKCPKLLPHETKAFQFSWGPCAPCLPDSDQRDGTFAKFVGPTIQIPKTRLNIRKPHKSRPYTPPALCRRSAAVPP